MANVNVQLHFDDFASSYKKFFLDEKSGRNAQFKMRLEIIRAMVAGSSGGFLDCACGTGEITAAALNAGDFARVSVLDISGEMLGFARQLLARDMDATQFEFHQGDIFCYAPPAGVKYDVILCLGLIAHTGQLDKLLRHLKKLLAPNGRIYLQSSLAEHWGNRFVRALTENRRMAIHGYPINYYSAHDVVSAALSSGLAVQDKRRYCFGFPFGDKLFRYGNYLLELVTGRVSSRFGSEAIFVLSAPKV